MSSKKSERSESVSERSRGNKSERKVEDLEETEQVDSPKKVELNAVTKDRKTKPEAEDDVNYDFTPSKGSSSLLATVVGLACFPVTILGACFCVKENEEAVLLSCGKYAGTIREPGVHFSNCWGREIITISKAKISTDIPNTKVIDRDGNPVMVSGVVVYHFRDTKKAAIDILDRQQFVADQAAAVMKQIVSHYPYDNHDVDSDEESDDDQKVPCLKQDTTVISQALVSELQKRVFVAGAKIDNFRFNEISYAPEIAASLLKKQQASAIVASRHTLVDGAVRIASASVSRLEKKNIAIDQADKGRLISNLLTVVCADEHVQPVISLGST